MCELTERGKKGYRQHCTIRTATRAERTELQVDLELLTHKLKQLCLGFLSFFLTLFHLSNLSFFHLSISACLSICFVPMYTLTNRRCCLKCFFLRCFFHKSMNVSHKNFHLSQMTFFFPKKVSSCDTFF